MNTVLIDTDYLIDFLRGKSALIVPFLEKNIAFISILSVYELYAGMKNQERKATDNLIEACHIEPVTMDIAKHAGKQRAQYREQGITLSVVDCIIAETARMKKHLLATNNKKHYPDNQFLETSNLKSDDSE